MKELPDEPSYYDDCPFCSLDTDRNFRSLVQNTVLLETKSFVVLPALGSFVDGYLIIATKNHLLNFTRLEDDQFREFRILHQNVTKVLRSHYGPIITFEHGNNQNLDRGGSCIDHAHVHLLPFGGDPWSIVGSPYAVKEIAPANQSREYDYLYLEADTGEARVYGGSEFPRQYMRQRLCSILADGLQDKWDWSAYPFIEKVERTIRAVKVDLGQSNTGGLL